MLDLTPHLTRVYLSPEDKLFQGELSKEEKFLKNREQARHFTIMTKKYREIVAKRYGGLRDAIIRKVMEGA